MAKNSFLDWSTTAASNTDLANVSTLGSAAVSNFDNHLRELMAQLRSGLDGKTVYAAKAANYTALATDNNAVMHFTASATLTLTAAATLASGWHMTVVADGGDVTIDGDASETIDGATTYVLKNGGKCAIICTGTAFFTVSVSRVPTVQIFTSSGTWTRPSGCTKIHVQVQAPGGGGGYAKPNASQAAVGAGGGGGAYSEGWVSDPAASYAVTIGAAGTGGVASTSTSATAGGVSSFGTVISCGGGNNGNNSGSTTVTGGSAAGGDGGTVSVGAGGVDISGGRGGPGIIFSGSICKSGEGGHAHLGSPAMGRFAPASGEPGRGYGAGGSGGANTNATNADGAGGAPSIIVVTEYYD